MYNYTPFYGGLQTPIFDNAYDDPDQVCIKVPRTAVALILGALLPAAYDEAWQGSTEQKAMAVRAAKSLIAKITEYEDCVMYRLRSDPIDPCHVQQSLDGGLTWITAFRLDGCGSSKPSIIDQIKADELVEQIMLDYTANPDVTYDYLQPTYDPELHPYVDLTLCFALQKLVEVICTAVATEIEASEDAAQQDASLGAAILGLAAAILGAFTGGATWVGYAALGAGIGAASAGLGGLLIDYPSANWLDHEAHKEVACCMFVALRGTRPTFSTLQNSLSQCAPSETDYWYPHFLAVGEALARVETFVGWSKIYDDMAELFAMGLPAEVVDCPCLTDWTHTIGAISGVGDPDAWNDDYVTIVYGSVSGGIVVGESAGDFADPTGDVSEVIINVPSLQGGGQSVITQVKIETRVQWKAGTSSRPQLWRIVGNDGDIVNEVGTWAFPQNNWTKNYPINQIVTQIQVRARINGNADILRITITGTGANPFAPYTQ